MSNNTSIETDNESTEFTRFHTSTDCGHERRSCLIDIGANINITNDMSILHDYHEVKPPVTITSSNGGKTLAYGTGSLNLAGKRPITITNVLFAPKITKTLLAGHEIIH